MAEVIVTISDQMVINVACYELGMRFQQCLYLLLAFEEAEIGSIDEFRVVLNDVASVSHTLSLDERYKQLELEVFDELRNPEWDLEYVSKCIVQMKKMAARQCDANQVEKLSFELGIGMVDCAESHDFDMA